MLFLLHPIERFVWVFFGVIFQFCGALWLYLWKQLSLRAHNIDIKKDEGVMWTFCSQTKFPCDLIYSRSRVKMSGFSFRERATCLVLCVCEKWLLILSPVWEPYSIMSRASVRSSRLCGPLTSPRVQQSQFVTHLSRSLAGCLWADNWADGHWDAGSAAGPVARSPPRRRGWFCPRCSAKREAPVPKPGSAVGQPAPRRQVSPSPLKTTRQTNSHDVLLLQITLIKY